MEKTNISTAISIMEELLANLDNAYWEATDIERKDIFYNIISAINRELTELAKLSIQDHNLEYEPVTAEFRIARSKLRGLHELVDGCVLRSRTAINLEALISDVALLTEH